MQTIQVGHRQGLAACHTVGRCRQTLGLSTDLRAVGGTQALFQLGASGACDAGQVFGFGRIIFGRATAGTKIGVSRLVPKAVADRGTRLPAVGGATCKQEQKQHDRQNRYFFDKLRHDNRIPYNCINPEASRTPCGLCRQSGGNVDLTKSRIAIAKKGDSLDLIGAWRVHLQEQPERKVFRFREQGRWQSVTTRQFLRDVARTITLLRSYGVKKGDRVVLGLPTGYPFVVLDHALMALHAISVPLYPTMANEDKTVILDECSPRLIAASTRKIVPEILAGDYPVIYLDDPALPNDYLARRIQTLEAVDLSEVQPIEPDALITIVYTSGTTGQVKGVKITARQVMAMLEGTMRIFPLDSTDRSYLFLPLAHIFGRLMPWVQAVAGMEMALVPDASQLQADLREIRPTVLAVVPRLLEKMHDQVGLAIRSEGGLSELIWDVAKKVAISRGRTQPPVFPLVSLIVGTIADKSVFRRIRHLFGGSVRFLISGGAPLNEELAAFFLGAGIPIVQGYGLTETTGVIFVNDPRHPVARGVGYPMAGVRYKILDDGELCVAGDNVFTGYWKKREKVLDVDGWFHTGDLVRLDENGRLVIHGRAKEILVTSGGKNIAPVKIETRLEGSPFIEKAVVIGDNRLYCVALVSVDKDAVLQAIDAREFPSFAVDPRVIRLIDREVAKVNMRLASYETIKYFRIIPGTLSAETGDLTPTLKPKRKHILEKFSMLIEEMYNNLLDDAETEDAVS